MSWFVRHGNNRLAVTNTDVCVLMQFDCSGVRGKTYKTDIRLINVQTKLFSHKNDKELYAVMLIKVNSLNLTAIAYQSASANVNNTYPF